MLRIYPVHIDLEILDNTFHAPVCYPPRRPGVDLPLVEFVSTQRFLQFDIFQVPRLGMFNL